MPLPTYENFEREHRARGFDEVLERTWQPGQVLDTHTHPFAVEAVVVKGELWLTCRGETRHLHAGDTFEIGLEEPHAERYGPDGAVFWAARKRPPAAKEQAA